jgi:hypothetical protein
VRDAVAIESQGIPTITIAHTTFERAARTHAAALGLPDIALLVHEPPVAGVVGGDVEVTDAQLELVSRALTGRSRLDTAS